MKLSYIALLGIAVVAASTGSANAADKVAVKFINKSKFAIHHLYLAPTKSDDWGPDQLGQSETDTILPNATFTLQNIPIGKYSLKLVDEDGDECMIDTKVVVNEDVVVTDENLLGCQGATEAAGGDEEEE